MGHAITTKAKKLTLKEIEPKWRNIESLTTTKNKTELPGALLLPAIKFREFLLIVIRRHVRRNLETNRGYRALDSKVEKSKGIPSFKTGKDLLLSSNERH